jgi:hypothetical protein
MYEFRHGWLRADRNERNWKWDEVREGNRFSGCVKRKIITIVQWNLLTRAKLL